MSVDVKRICGWIWKERLVLGAFSPSAILVFWFVVSSIPTASQKPVYPRDAAAMRLDAEFRTFAEYGPIEVWVTLPFDDRIRVVSEMCKILLPDAPEFRKRENVGIVYDSLIRSTAFLKEEQPMLDQLQEVIRDIRDRELREHLKTPGKRL